MLLVAAACAPLGGTKEGVVASAAASRFPACESEIKAFFALNRLAMRSGDERPDFETALEAMQDQMTECVDDNYSNLSNIQPIAGKRGRVGPDTAS